ncbi:MAG: bifunctional methylenetetrahydrofolate dehydrogenase/methenyltetrahydrofolate cyclohydrolase FolD [Spirochaetia bacterium]|nr:bifunctional methylenetetrahydrofolate dehydrogenase/methenyltetrahydrofolate cyclohydrolase FolD [Spirochaetia bacterium]
MARIIDGNAVSKEIREDLKKRVAKLQELQNITPGLAVILVGENPASQSYVRAKHRACKNIGIRTKDFNFPSDISEAEILNLVDTLNNDPEIHGILVQLPLSAHIDEQKVLLKIHPDKDVDGFHPQSIGKLVIGLDTFFPCTPFGIIKLLEHTGISPEGKHVCVVGRSNIVGKPIANLLMQKEKHANATVTVCHSRTPDIKNFTLQADIVIAAIGKPEFITADMVKEGAVVIDVGINRIDDPEKEKGYRLVGDVDFDNVSKIASAITPVPGGVGPMTITMLMYNTILSAERAHY